MSELKNKIKNIKIIFSDFDGVWTDNKVYTDSNGIESVVCSKEDSLGLDYFREKTGLPVIVISKEQNVCVRHRCDKLKLPIIAKTHNKTAVLDAYLREKGWGWNNTCYIGNDWNDLDCLRKSAFGVCPADAVEEVKEVCDYVCEKNGGNGAVREIFNLFFDNFDNMSDVNAEIKENDSYGCQMLKKPPVIIAEIACNHKGDINIAKEMIKVAKFFCGADMVKFQKRNNKELLNEEEYNAPHPASYNSYGKTYGEHREFLEFDLEQHRELKNFCEYMEIEYSSSIWDLTSAKEITSLNPKSVKIPSACNLKFDILEYLCLHFMGEIHISLGMTSKEEEKKIIDFFDRYARAKDLVVYSCTSGYPVPHEDLCLLEIVRLREQFGDKVKAIGFSGHHNGIAADIAAMTLGAEYIERHYTLDRTWKGTDHAASLEPDGLRRIARDTKDIFKALRYKHQDILDIEEVQRKKLKRF